MEINIYLSLEITLQNGTKQYLHRSKSCHKCKTLVDHRISRFDCPHSFHSDQGRKLESKLFEQLMQLLEMDKTRTTRFHPQSNAAIGRLKRTSQNMLAKRVNDEQSNWSQ